MKRALKVLGIITVLALAADVCSASSFVFEQVNPTQTYGTPSGGGATGTAVWIPLSAFSGLGTITPGTTHIDIVPTGAVCFTNCGTNPQTPVSSLGTPIFIAGFSASGSSTTFLSTTLGTFNTGGGGSGDWTNSFSNQFGISYNGNNGTGFFTIPTTATEIVVVFRDNFYPDNVSTGGTLGVDVSISNVPEPASYAMLLGGLGLLAGWRRFRRS
jgi:hypothetical protein